MQRFIIVLLALLCSLSFVATAEAKALGPKGRINECTHSLLRSRGYSEEDARNLLAGTIIVQGHSVAFGPKGYWGACAAVEEQFGLAAAETAPAITPALTKPAMRIVESPAASTVVALLPPATSLVQLPALRPAPPVRAPRAAAPAPAPKPPVRTAPAAHQTSFLTDGFEFLGRHLLPLLIVIPLLVLGLIGLWLHRTSSRQPLFLTEEAPAEPARLLQPAEYAPEAPIDDDLKIPEPRIAAANDLPDQHDPAPVSAGVSGNEDEALEILKQMRANSGPCGMSLLEAYTR